jgi:hypothetical protein
MNLTSGLRRIFKLLTRYSSRLNKVAHGQGIVLWRLYFIDVQQLSRLLEFAIYIMFVGFNKLD